MVRVLVVNTVTFHINGMSNVIMSLYTNMIGDDIRFDFVVNDRIHKGYEDVIHQNGDRIFVLKRSIKDSLRYICTLSKIIKNGDYDIIHIHGNSATMSLELAAVRKSGTKAKTLVHAHNTACNYPIINKVLYPYFIRNADYRIACSKAAGEWLYKENKFIVLNNGIDEGRFRFDHVLRQKQRQALGVQDRFVVLHVGRFNEQKNHTYLLKVFQALLKKEPDAQLRLVGEGPLLDDVKKQVEQMRLKKSVIFAGVTNTPEFEYLAADVFVLPSLFESFGLVNVEAQCSGLPCVISDAVPKEIAVTKDVSFLSVKEDPEKWADTVLIYKKAKRKDHSEDVILAGYSSRTEALKLKSFLMKIVNK